MNSKAEPVVAGAGSSKPVVLVVEDEPILRRLSVAVVEVADLEAVEADNADEAIQILESRPTFESFSPTSGCPALWMALSWREQFAGVGRMFASFSLREKMNWEHD